MQFSHAKYYVSNDYRVYVFSDRESLGYYMFLNPSAVEVDKDLALSLAPGEPNSLTNNIPIVVDLDFNNTMPDGYIGEIIVANPLEWPSCRGVH